MQSLISTVYNIDKFQKVQVESTGQDTHPLLCQCYELGTKSHKGCL